MAVSMDDYKLSCELIGHSMDVRGVGEVPAGIVSVSRDKTAKIWKTDGLESSSACFAVT